jgi:hypothetical protein
MSIIKLMPIKMALLAALMIGSGCNNEDARVAEVAAKRQAQQNQEMAHLNREVAAGTKRLVEGQAEADQRFQSIQKDIHTQRDQLEIERRQQAETWQRDSLSQPTIAAGIPRPAELLPSVIPGGDNTMKTRYLHAGQ